MSTFLLAVLLLAQAQSKVRVCDKADPTHCATVAADGTLKTSAGSVTASTTCHATAVAPTYGEGTDDALSCSLDGTLRTAAGAGGASDVTIHDNGTPANHLAIDGAGKIGINNSSFDISDRVGRLLGHVTIDNATLAVTESGAPWTVDVTDRVARLLGVVYGSQGQQLKQTAVNFNLQVEDFVDGSAIDPRSIRLLTSSDVVDVSDRSARLLGHVTIDNASIAVTGTFWQATQPVSGNVTAAQGTAAAVGGAWPIVVTDGTNSATVKAASTQSGPADKALVAVPRDPGNTTGTNITATGQNSDITLGGGISTLGLTTTGSWTGTITWFASHDGTNFFNITGAGPNSGGAFPSFTSANGNLLFQVGSYKVVRITSSGSWTGTMTPVWNPGLGSNINGIVSWGDGNVVFKFTTKGAQQANAIPIQAMNDSGRVIKVYSAANFTAATTEALVTLTPIADGTAGATGTSFAVTASKRLRLTALTCDTKNAGAATQGVVVKVRMTASGAVTASSPLIAVCAAGNTGVTANQTVGMSVAIPDGIELSGTMQVGISEIGTATAGNDVTLIGYEY